MNDNNEIKTEELEELTEEQKKKNFMTHFYISLGCFIAGCVLLILAVVFTFAIKNGIAVYFLIASMIAELAAISFLNYMKQKGGEGKLRSVFVILNYVVMGVALAIFIAGTGTSIFVKSSQ
ncbi:MAG: hypothetical protein ACI4QN_02305 [Candidatus Coproplasma sp.]